jgi:hypothetical protein
MSGIAAQKGNPSEWGALFVEAIEMAHAGEFDVAASLFERGATVRTEVDLLETFHVNDPTFDLRYSTSEDQPYTFESFQIIQRYYRPDSLQVTSELATIETSVRSSEWSSSIASVFNEDVLEPVLMLLRRGDSGFWEEIAEEMESAVGQIADFAMALPRAIVRIACCYEAAGDKALATTWFDRAEARLARGPNCMCGVEGCTMGVGEWLSYLRSSTGL